MESAIGIDSILVKKEWVHPTTGEQKSFKCVLGCGISTKNYSEFKDLYDNAIDATLKSCGIKKDKFIYCNYDFSKIFAQCGIPIHQIFWRNIAPSIEAVNIFYTLFKKDYTPLAFGRLERELKHKLSNEVLNFNELVEKHLNNYFPYICVWRIKDFLSKNGITPMLDSFQGKITEAWEEISHIPIHVYPSGDKCNPLISTADIALQLVELRLNRQKKFIQYGNFRSILPEMNNKVYEYSISGYHYRKIIPLHSKNIRVKDRYKHPIVFVFKDKNQFISSEALKNEPTMDTIFTFANMLDGCVKFFKSEEDTQLIQNGDYAVYFSDEGKRAIETFKKM